MIFRKSFLLIKGLSYFVFFGLLLYGCKDESTNSITKSDSIYLDAQNRIITKENKTFYIDPVNGDDRNSGINENAAWKGFRNINQRLINNANVIKIIRAGNFYESLYLITKPGISERIKLIFSPGKYYFYPEKALAKQLAISNTNDAPDSLKKIAFYLYRSQNVNIDGKGAEIIFQDKSMIFCIDSCSNINIENLKFDYSRPTVSEMKCINIKPQYADFKVHPDSKFSIKDSLLYWKMGDDLYRASYYWQIADTMEQTVKRIALPLSELKYTRLGKERIRALYNKPLSLHISCIYQNRNTFRDYAAFFTQNSNNISWSQIRIFFMHGMGFVNQISKNIRFDKLIVRPRSNSGRTSAAWADILHFSNCKGNISIKNSYLSSMQDDAINVHGSYLVISDSISARKIRLTYMHPQTYGFQTFFEGNQVEFVDSKTLIPYAYNTVASARLINDKTIEIELKDSMDKAIRTKSVLGNLSFQPNVRIENTEIKYCPTRGILLTGKGENRINNCSFYRTTMSAVLIVDDASSWYESGRVNNLHIENNSFNDCGTPIILVHPENRIHAAAVHKNIVIKQNTFLCNNPRILAVKSSENINFNHNIVRTKEGFSVKEFFNFRNCTAINIDNNRIMKR